MRTRIASISRNETNRIISCGEPSDLLPLVALTCTKHFGLIRAEEHAYLIAAAPELFESCRILTELLSYWLPRIKEQCGGDVTYKAELEKARAALVKARHPKIKKVSDD